MKKSLIFLCFVGCAQIPPEYAAPSLVSPQNGESFSEFVTFEWSANNNADHTTGDYSFLVEVATDTAFTQIKAHYLTKLETRYYAPLYAFRNGVNYWRVTATYTQQTTGEKTVLRSAVRSFSYTGNDGAVYVDPLTAGAGILGTKAEPVKTIHEAFGVASRRGLVDVRLANATYTETIGTSFIGTIKGCYDTATWSRNISTCATSLTDITASAYYSPAN